MFMEKTWSLAGKNGRQYTFEVSSKSAALPDSGGIYIPVYAHPRGHLAGFQVSLLGMGETADLQLTVSGLQQHRCLLDQCWNYTLILRMVDAKKRKKTLSDLVVANPCRC